MEKINYIDFAFRYGTFNSVQEMTGGKNNAYVKLNALLNIMNMRPGTYQDVPYMGLNMDGVLFSENGREMKEVQSNIENQLMTQCELYIEPNFLEGITIDYQPSKGGEMSGEMEVTFSLQLTGGYYANITSTVSKVGIQHQFIVVDDKPFGDFKTSLL